MTGNKQAIYVLDSSLLHKRTHRIHCGQSDNGARWGEKKGTRSTCTGTKKERKLSKEAQSKPRKETNLRDDSLDGLV